MKTNWSLYFWPYYLVGSLNVVLIAAWLIIVITGCAPSSDSTPDSPPPPPPRYAAYLMTDHGGVVLHNSKVHAIFWGSSWPSNPTKENGLITFLSGLAGSHYITTGNEYYDGSGYLSGGGTYTGYHQDTTASPSLNTSSGTYLILNEVCKETGNNPDPTTLYLVYTDVAQNSSVSYCGWHSYGYCGGHITYFAYIPNLDMDPWTDGSSCHVNDYSTGHSQGLASEASVSAHEIMETFTDPQLNNWYDNDPSGGQEIGDKCAWAFPPSLTTLSNGSQWKIQMEWSNRAFLNGTGLPNTHDQWGCAY